MINWSLYLVLDEPKLSPKTIIDFSYSLRGLISCPISLILTLELEYCSRGDLVIIKRSRSVSRERVFNIGYVLPEKDGPNKNFRLLLANIRDFSNTLGLHSVDWCSRWIWLFTNFFVRNFPHRWHSIFSFEQCLHLFFTFKWKIFLI